MLRRAAEPTHSNDPGTLIPGPEEIVGNLGTGHFIQNGGTNADVTGSGYYLTIGGDTSTIGTGIYDLTGDGVLSFDTEYVGNSGTSVGTVNQSGGSNFVGALILGNGQTDANHVSQGTYNLSGGTLNTTSLTVAYQGEGTFTQTGGTHIVAGAISFATGGAALPSQGIYNLNAGTLQLQGGMNNDAGGTGMFNLGGGTLQATASFNVDQISADNVHRQRRERHHRYPRLRR